SLAIPDRLALRQLRIILDLANPASITPLEILALNAPAGHIVGADRGRWLTGCRLNNLSRGELLRKVGHSLNGFRCRYNDLASRATQFGDQRFKVFSAGRKQVQRNAAIRTRTDLEMDRWPLTPARWLCHYLVLLSTFPQSRQRSCRNSTEGNHWLP